MILEKTIYHDGTIVLVFKNTEKEGEKKTVERLVAEVICELGKCHQGVACSAIHFASFGHPFSATQRLREMKDKFISHQFKNITINEMGGCNANIVSAYHFDRAENKYYFSPEFISWLYREYLKQEPANVPAD